MEENNLNNPVQPVEENFENQDDNTVNLVEDHDKNNLDVDIGQNDDNDNGDSEGFSLSDKVNLNNMLIWGISGLIFSVVLVFLVSLISGTLQFVLGRLLIFGILFFVAGGLLRLLIDIFAPDVFESNDSSYADDLSSEYDHDGNVPMGDHPVIMEDGMVGGNIDASIDDNIDTDPIFDKNPTDVQDEAKRKYGNTKEDFINVEGTDVVIPNNTDLIVKTMRTVIARDED